MRLHQGFNGRTPVWYTHEEGKLFRGQRFVDEVLPRLRHKGWYADDDCCETVRGIVVSLSHGRFLAGRGRGTDGQRTREGRG